MKRWIPFIAAAAVIAFLSGCSGSESSRKSSTSSAGEQDHKVASGQFEGSFNPSDYDDEIEVIQKQHVFEQQHAPPPSGKRIA